jgi:hypothetical protein
LGAAPAAFPALAQEASMLKILVQDGDEWRGREGEALYERQITASGALRLHAVWSSTRPGLFRELATGFAEPIGLLYILHTPRGEGEPGRYRSPDITRHELDRFLTRFADFLSADARCDFWVRSHSTGDLIVWDRHNDLYAYGDLDQFARTLDAAGFRESSIAQLGPHEHHYRSEFDAAARDVLAALAWSRTPLHPDDAQ